MDTKIFQPGQLATGYVAPTIRIHSPIEYFGVTEEDIKAIRSTPASVFFSVAATAFGISVPCLLNMIILHESKNGWTRSDLVNGAVGIFFIAITIIAGIVSGVMHKNKDNLIGEIKGRNPISIKHIFEEHNSSSGTSPGPSTPIES